MNDASKLRPAAVGTAARNGPDLFVVAGAHAAAADAKETARDLIVESYSKERCDLALQGLQSGDTPLRGADLAMLSAALMALTLQMAAPHERVAVARAIQRLAFERVAQGIAR